MKPKQQRMFAAAIAGLLAFLMIFGLISTLFDFRAVGLTASSSNLSKLKDELNKMVARKKALEAENNKLKKEENNILKQISSLDDKIDAMDKEIEINQTIVTQLNELIEQKTNDIAIKQTEESEQYEKLKARARVMYEAGELSYLSVLLESDGFYEFLSRYEVINQISSYDRELFEEIKALKEGIITEKANLEIDKADQEQMVLDLEARRKALEKERGEKNTRYANLEDERLGNVEEMRAIADEEDRLNKEINEMVRKLAEQTKKTYVGGDFTWPAPGYTRVTSNFGMRFHPVLKENRMHTGTDVSVPSGSSIVAMNSGTVIVSTYNSALGNYIVVDHGGGVATLYAHLSSRLVSKGAKVTQKQKIGLSGSTGYSTGPHLHFEVMSGGKNVNPMSYFKLQ